MTNGGFLFHKYQLVFYISMFSIFLISCRSMAPNRIEVNIPTAEAETEYIWRTIQDIAFFEEQNYQLSLPHGALIENLKVKAKLGQLAQQDYENLEVFVRDSVYSIDDYQKGFEQIAQRLELINKMINEISESSFNWNFREFETYQVNLTLYGPGGSYDPNEGSILIFTTPEGKFKNYDNPACTIIHEIVHIGIEESLITKYEVPHPLKERIVDGFVLLSFGGLLPEYTIQDMGEKRADEYLKTKADLKNLDQMVETVLKEH